MKKLKTLEEFSKKLNYEKVWGDYKRSGVECPECKKELMLYIGVQAINMLQPTPKILKCSKCEFKITL